MTSDSTDKVIFMYLSGVNFALDDVQNGDITVVVFPVSKCRYHYIFRLKERERNFKQKLNKEINFIFIWVNLLFKDLFST